MPGSLQKTPIKLGVTGCLALLVFNYPLLSLYRGALGAWPVLYLALFGLWLALIVLAWRMMEGAGSRAEPPVFKAETQGRMPDNTDSTSLPQQPTPPMQEPR